MITRLADPGRMKLLSALVRDPNLIHLEGERPVNQGPMVMAWLLEAAGHHGGYLESFQVRFVTEILAGDVVSCLVTQRRPTPHGVDLLLEARVHDTVVAAAVASVQT